tara:strand:+ start:491 stop:820 length:330 start_codon:yes stop_codon:yes gene_type:complete
MNRRNYIQTKERHTIVYGYDDGMGYGGHFISIHHFGAYTDEFGPDAGDLRVHHYDTREIMTVKDHSMLEYLPGKRPHQSISGFKRFHLTKEKYLRLLKRLGLKSVRWDT